MANADTLGLHFFQVDALSSGLYNIHNTDIAHVWMGGIKILPMTCSSCACSDCNTSKFRSHRLHLKLQIHINHTSKEDGCPVGLEAASK